MSKGMTPEELHVWAKAHATGEMVSPVAVGILKVFENIKTAEGLFGSDPLGSVALLGSIIPKAMKSD